MNRLTILTLSIAGIIMCGCNNKSKIAESIGDISIAKYHGDKQAAISFTYDDGTLCHYLEVAPELEKRGFRGTFWIVGANIGTDVPDYPYMTWEQVADLSKRGHEISNHSWTHPDLTKISEQELDREITLCDSAILNATGKRPITFCYPYNAMSDSVVKRASDGRVGTRTYWDAQGQEVSQCTDESLKQWLDSTITNKVWAVTMTHATNYGWDKWNDPQVLWRLYDRVKERESEVWVATFAEVAAYTKEAESTKLSVEAGKDCLTITPNTDIDTKLFTQPLTLRINGEFTGVKISARQSDKGLDVTNNGDHILLDFMPGEGVINIKF